MLYSTLFTVNCSENMSKDFFCQSPGKLEREKVEDWKYQKVSNVSEICRQQNNLIG